MTDVPWTWLLMRSGGLVAVGLLSISVFLGLIGPRLRPSPRLMTVNAHRAAAVSGSLLIVGHVVLAILDRWITLDWPAALLPGAADWKRWGVAAGALALDLLIVVLITTATRYRAARVWRRAHLLAYPVWALAAGHGVAVGTDTALARWTALLGCALVLGGLAVRLLAPATSPAASPRLGAGGAQSGPLGPQGAALAKQGVLR